MSSKNIVPILCYCLIINVACSDALYPVEPKRDLKDTPRVSNRHGIVNSDVFTNDFTPDPNDTTSFFLEDNHPAILNMRKRAKQIASVRWSALDNIPSIGGFFQAGGVFTGIPYSSVKEKDKFIGQEVSFYTFMSAVNNPRSVLYTEHVNEYPYHGVNCASYYGSVCSMTVNYALGIDRPYGSIMYGTLPFIKRVSDQDWQSAMPGDIVWMSGHVLMILDTDRDESNHVSRIEILENRNKCAYIKSYSLTDFERRFEGIDWVLYRCTKLADLADETGLFVAAEDEYLDQIQFNEALCTSRGDKVAFREGEDVIINVLSADYNCLELYRSGLLVDRHDYTGMPDIAFNNLPYGFYQARLCGKGKTSSTISFEIIQTDVSVTTSTDDIICISFESSNATPEYVVFCDDKGSRYFISDITDDELRVGNKKVRNTTSLENRYVKVFFRSKYGRVSNSILPLFNTL